MINIESFKLLATGISRYADMLYRPDVAFEHFCAFRDALSHPQLQSKIHLLDLAYASEIPCDKTLFIAHWHGLLPYLFLKSQITRVAIGIELDPQAKTISEYICSDLSWNSILQDALKAPNSFYAEQAFDCVINTSCEHMDFAWLKPIPKDTWIIAQANNFQIPEHIHPQKSLNDFKQNLSLSTITAADEIDFGVYKRFTVIGRR